ncbi:MAG: MlaD family protein [Candidatus Omnitrophota bacterium]
MIFGKTKLELKVGAFVFFGIVILTIFVLMIGKFRTWSSGYRINTKFSFVNGVKLGAPVRFAGVDVGEVKKIDFIFDDKSQKSMVNISCWIKNYIKVPVDSTVWVNTLGLLGEKYIEIMPGNNVACLVQAGDTLVGRDPIAMHEVAELAKNIVTDIDKNVINNREGTIGRLLYDPSLYDEVDDLVRDLKANPWKLLWKSKEKPVPPRTKK